MSQRNTFARLPKFLFSFIFFFSTLALQAQFSPPIPAPGMGYEMVFYHDQPYLVLQTILWRYNGTTYNPIGYPTGFEAQTNFPVLVYQDKIYIAGVQRDMFGNSWPRLYSYNGSVFQEVILPSGKAISYHNCDMAIFQNKLFVTATSAGPDNDPNGWVIIDGSSVSFQNFSGQKLSHEKGMTIFNNQLCLIVNHFTGEPRLLLYDGTSSTLVQNPSGTYFTGAMVNVAGELYLKEARPVPGGVINQLVKYNGGTSFTTISNPAGYQVSDELEFHKDFLYTLHIQNGTGNKQLFRFDGTTFLSIPNPAGTEDLKNLTSHECRLYMTLNNGVPNLLYYQTLCFGIIPFPVFDCNRFLGCHLLFRFHIYGNQFKLGTLGQWENAEGYPNVPFSLQLLNSRGALVWEQYFDSDFEITLPSRISYQTLNVSLGTGKYKTKILTFDKSFLGSGANGIELEFKPQEDYNYFNITGAYTGNLLKIELLDEQGSSVWSKQIRPPFSQSIPDKINRPGTTLVFSSSRRIISPFVEENSSIIRYYPNPSEDKLIVELSDWNNEELAQVSLHNMTGELVYSHSFSATSGNELEIERQKLIIQKKPCMKIAYFLQLFPIVFVSLGIYLRT